MYAPDTIIVLIKSPAITDHHVVRTTVRLTMALFNSMTPENDAVPDKTTWKMTGSEF